MFFKLLALTATTVKKIITEVEEKSFKPPLLSLFIQCLVQVCF